MTSTLTIVAQLLLCCAARLPQVRIKLKHMELEIRRRETSGAGAAAKSESGAFRGAWHSVLWAPAVLLAATSSASCMHICMLIELEKCLVSTLQKRWQSTK